MLFKTRGLVLNHIKFRETSIITKIFTEEFGIQTYIVNGVRSSKSRIGIGLFQPLTLLDLVVYHKPNGNIKRISEIKCSYPYKSIPFEIKKSVIGIFLSEVLSKTLKEENPDAAFFNFLIHSVRCLDEMDQEYENFHLKFLIGLSHYLGFRPSTAADIINNGFSNPGLPEEVEFLERLLINEEKKNQTSNFTRRKSLEHILNFYAAHLENFGTLKSVKILKEILSE